jgi:hypothetical protein
VYVKCLKASEPLADVWRNNSRTPETRGKCIGASSRHQRPSSVPCPRKKSSNAQLTPSGSLVGPTGHQGASRSRPTAHASIGPTGTDLDLVCRGVKGLLEACPFTRFAFNESFVPTLAVHEAILQPLRRHKPEEEGRGDEAEKQPDPEAEEEGADEFEPGGGEHRRLQRSLLDPRAVSGRWDAGD